MYARIIVYFTCITKIGGPKYDIDPFVILFPWREQRGGEEGGRDVGANNWNESDRSKQREAVQGWLMSQKGEFEYKRETDSLDGE